MIRIAARVTQPFVTSPPPAGQVDPRMTAVASEARAVLDAVRSPTSHATLLRNNDRLQDALHRLLQPLPAAAAPLAESLRGAQAAIDELTNSLPGLTWKAAPSPRAARTEIEPIRERIDATQNLVHHVIAKSVEASGLHGEALKTFMKTVYPKPADLARHANVVLPLDKQSEIADQSKRLQRFAGVPRRRDLAAWAGKLPRVTRKQGASANSAEQVRTLAFIAARTRDPGRRQQAMHKLAAVLRRDPDQSLSNVMNETWYRLSASTELHTFYGLYGKLVAGEATAAERDAAAQALHRVRDWHDKGENRLSAPQRRDLARALAPLADAGDQRFKSLRDAFMADEAGAPATTPDVARRFTPDLIRDMGPRIEFSDLPQGAASTRAAGYLKLDGETYYCKEIGHGPRAALSEYLSMQLIALTGQMAPVTKIGRVGGTFVILSRVIPGYQDLGKILLDTDRMSGFAGREWGEGGRSKVRMLSERAHAANADIEQLAADGYDKKSAARKTPRKKLFEARAELIALLPRDMSRQLHKAQFLSRLLGHNDFLNGEFYNVGFNDADECVVLDFGNALNQGFGGRQRNEDNLPLANRLAYPENDPYEANPIRPVDHVFSGRAGDSRTNVGAIPRSGPTTRVVSDAIRAETRLAEAGTTREQMTAVPVHEIDALEGQLEAAYQLSLLPDDALRAVVLRHWAGPDDESVPYQPHETIRMPAEELGEILVERRHALVGQFTPDEIGRWAQKHPRRARACHADVKRAVREIAGMSIPDFSMLAPAGEAGPSRKRRFSV
ncbi:hypothetical protein [Noviherbaspirillum aridicola]|uniref:Uncharacterized protein n=1 Tax=Noviherbaspirillum aridicola TaxID=2849687 RepID=A0ABQ4Q869_9BURK|nr:hypothetical protein [Noviherbaspirillum aridicola]GIZ53252.1 hypothetical protein NCCP691_32660 [Noviherbaspirillum aridicola]